jgi:DNA modification methylase
VLICDDAAPAIDKLEKDSIHLCVTSPPYYNAREEYAEYKDLLDYIDQMKEVFRAVKRVLVPGGRVCINASNYGNSPRVPLPFLLHDMMYNMYYRFRGDIVWNKAASGSGGGSTAWGSYLLPSSPSVRDVHEMILVFDLDGTRLEGDREKSTITKDEFLEYTKSVWTIPTESAKKIGHPAPFPVELPRRLIQLYSYEDNVVLDPFAGSCTTGVAAQMLNRDYICIDRSQEYLEIGKKRLCIESDPKSVEF